MRPKTQWPRLNKFAKEVREVIEKEGAEITDVYLDSRDHYQFCLRLSDGRVGRMSASNSPRDTQRNTLNTRARLRRWIRNPTQERP